MIKDFISLVKTRGLARTNRYRVEIPFPQGGLYGVDDDSARITPLLCDSTTIPGVNIATTPSRFYGEVREMPYEKTFDNVTMTFYVDSNMLVKAAFDKWMAMIINPYDRTIGYYDQYKRDITIHVENIDGSSPMSVKLFEAYPKSVGPIQMDSGSRDVMKLSVTWQYRYWLSNVREISNVRATPPLDELSQDPAGITTGPTNNVITT